MQSAAASFILNNLTLFIGIMKDINLQKMCIALVEI